MDADLDLRGRGPPPFPWITVSTKRGHSSIVGGEWLQAAVASLGRPGRRPRPANENTQTPRVVSASIRRVQSR